MALFATGPMTIPYLVMKENPEYVCCNFWRYFLAIFLVLANICCFIELMKRGKLKNFVPTPGIEPGPPGWKPDILTARPRGSLGYSTQSVSKQGNRARIWDFGVVYPLSFCWSVSIVGQSTTLFHVTFLLSWYNFSVHFIKSKFPTSKRMQKKENIGIFITQHCMDNISFDGTLFIRLQ